VGLHDFKMIFLGLFLILALVAASPTLSMIIYWPAGERFTELWILGSTRMAENFPFIVQENQSYNIFLGISSHMEDLEYYVAYVKFGNEAEPLPNSTLKSPSPSKPLHEYRVFLSDGEIWEENIVFSFSGISIEMNTCRISYLNVGSYSLFVNKTTLLNTEREGYFFHFVFELWRYDTATSEFQYHNRFVSLGLKIESP
jgi:hypothetical protein